MQTNPKTRILLVEDDKNLGSVLQEFLELKGFEVSRCEDGASALVRSQESPYALYILDIMMPKKDGFTLARDLRGMNDQTPIIFLTARGRLEDKVEGYQAGCDDYLTKPFSMEELMLRISAVMRRATPDDQGQTTRERFQLGGVTFDYAHRTIHIGTHQQTLTSREADLLRLFAQHTNAVVKRELALKLIWGDDSYFNARSMDVFISKLRKYLGDGNGASLQNVHGIGYKLQVE